MNFDNVQKELLKYFTENPIYRIFLPICEALLLGGQLLLIVNNLGVNLGVISTIVTIIVYVAIVVVLSKGEYKVLLLGLSLRTIMYAINIVKAFFGSHPYFNINSLIYMLVWGYFAYRAYKKMSNIQ